MRTTLDRFVFGSISESDPLPPECDRGPESSPALERIYRRERSRLLGFVHRRVHGDDAEDVVQRSFTRFMERVDAEAIERPEAYLRRTAQNIIIDDARRSARIGAQIQVEEISVADGDPVAMLEARDRLRRIEAAVDRLKPLTRQIFLACRVDGLTHAEVAKQTGLSVKGVEKQMGKAIRQLSRHLRHND